MSVKPAATEILERAGICFLKLCSVDKGDQLVYDIVKFKKEGSDLFLGTTAMQHGQVNGEVFMKSEHFHKPSI